MYERLQRAAKRAGLNIRTLTREAGLSDMTLYKVKTGTTPSQDTLLAVSRVIAGRTGESARDVYLELTDLEAELA